MEQARMGEMEMGGMEMAQAPRPREQTINGLNLALATQPDPPQKGENLVRLTVKSEAGPVTDAKVTFAYTMAMPGMEVETVEAKPIQDGIYEAQVNFGMKGDWQIDATVARSNANPIRAQFTVQVSR